jgi:capsid protein
VPATAKLVWDAAYLSGKIRTLKHRPSWTPPRWEYIQPEVDVKTELLEIAGGLKTHSEALRGRGEDPEEFIAEKQQELKDFEKAGVKFDYGTGKVGNGVAVADDSNGKPGTVPEKPAAEE